MKYQRDFFPIFSLEMVLEEDTLKFRETAEFVKGEFRNLVRNLVVCFNNILHPRVCKVQIDVNNNMNQNLNSLRNWDNS